MRTARGLVSVIAMALGGTTLALAPPAHAETSPPYAGTVFLGTQLLTSASPTDLLTVTPAGRGTRTTFDRRRGWVTQDAYLFTAAYTGSAPTEVIVDPEFGSTEAARAQAEYYARVVGQLPRSCRTQVDALWIHGGDQRLGGGNRSLLIHTGYEAANPGYLEEALLHECGHTSIDYAWNGAAQKGAWDAAAAADPGFLSTYARDNPQSEDVAESFGPYIAWKLGSASTYSPEQLATIAAQIPHRLAYLDSLNLDLAPMYPHATGAPTSGLSTPSAAPHAGSLCPRSMAGRTIRTPSGARLRCGRTGTVLRWQRVGR